jgi:hypothetical protein
VIDSLLELGAGVESRAVLRGADWISCLVERPR